MAETIGDRIREARQARTWGQRKLATTLGVPQSRISDWERGRWAPARANLAKIAKALGVTTDSLLGADQPGHTEGDTTTSPSSMEGAYVSPAVAARVRKLERENAALKRALAASKTIIHRAAGTAGRQAGAESRQAANRRPRTRGRH